MQTDPIFYEDQMNIYAYAGNDPMNYRDPAGMQAEAVIEEEVVVTGVACSLCHDENIRAAAREFVSDTINSAMNQALKTTMATSPLLATGLLSTLTSDAPSFEEDEFTDCDDLLNRCNDALKETNRDSANPELLNECIRNSSSDCASEFGID